MEGKKIHSRLKNYFWKVASQKKVGSNGDRKRKKKEKSDERFYEKSGKL